MWHMFQTTPPGKGFEVPGAHAVQSAPPLPVKPAVHVQLLILAAPPSEDEPTGQFEHVAEPVAPNTVEYVPAGHSTHVSGVFGPGSLA